MALLFCFGVRFVIVVNVVVTVDDNAHLWFQGDSVIERRMMLRMVFELGVMTGVHLVAKHRIRGFEARPLRRCLVVAVLAVSFVAMAGAAVASGARVLGLDAAATAALGGGGTVAARDVVHRVAFFSVVTVFRGDRTRKAGNARNGQRELP